MSVQDRNSFFASLTASPGNSSSLETLSPTIEFHDPNISTLTDSQEVILSVLSIISGTLSFFGSSIIIYRVYKKHRTTEGGLGIGGVIGGGVRNIDNNKCNNNNNNKNGVQNHEGTAGSNKTIATITRKPINKPTTTPYDRIMLGLSVFDMIASFTYAINPFLLPSETSPRVWAKGNTTTCSALGFLTQIAFGAAWYNCMLSFYYLATVRFGVKREVFAKKYEIWIHTCTISYFVFTAISGLVIGAYSELEITQGCWIGEYPEGCEARGDCKGTFIGWLFGGFPTLITFFSLPINNAIIYCYTRKQLTLAADANNNDITASQATRAHRIREVASQGFLYVFTFYVCYTPAFIVRVLEGMGWNGEDEEDMYFVLVLSSLLLPLQGFFNVFIYTRPNYIRVKAAYPEQPQWWLVRHACLDSDIPRLTDARSLGSNGSSKKFPKVNPGNANFQRNKNNNRSNVSSRSISLLSEGSDCFGDTGGPTFFGNSSNRNVVLHATEKEYNHPSKANANINKNIEYPGLLRSPNNSHSRSSGSRSRSKSSDKSLSGFASDLDIIIEGESDSDSEESLKDGCFGDDDNNNNIGNSNPGSPPESPRTAALRASARAIIGRNYDSIDTNSTSADEFFLSLEDIEAQIEEKMAMPKKSSFRIVTMDGSIHQDEKSTKKKKVESVIRSKCSNRQNTQYDDQKNDKGVYQKGDNGYDDDNNNNNNKETGQNRETRNDQSRKRQEGEVGGTMQSPPLDNNSKNPSSDLTRSNISSSSNIRSNSSNIIIGEIFKRLDRNTHGNSNESGDSFCCKTSSGDPKATTSPTVSDDDDDEDEDNIRIKHWNK